MIKSILTSLVFAMAAVSCSPAQAQRSFPSPIQARAVREQNVIRMCSMAADLQANIMTLRMNGAPKATARQYVYDQMGAIGVVNQELIGSFQNDVKEIYAVAPFASSHDVTTARGFLFNKCVNAMLADPT